MGFYLLILGLLRGIPLVLGDVPEVSLLQKDPSSPIICHVMGMFSRGDRVFWERDGKELRDGVELGEIKPDGIGKFKTQTTLNVSPEDLQTHKYICVVQHVESMRRIVAEVKENKPLLSNGDVIYLSIFVICVVVANGIIVAILGSVKTGCTCNRGQNGYRLESS